jgi:glutamate N-acetyltransferase/amino-acid N-acetyltransferase
VTVAVTPATQVDRSAGVTAPAGFRAAGVIAGIKPAGTPDLTVVVNDGPYDVAAGVFTTNKVKAAPVLWSQQVLTAGALKAVVLNSGGANACTGPEGFQDTHKTAEKLAEVLGVGAAQIGVCSTGLIGERLPMSALIPGIDAAVADLGDDAEHGLAAATAVMTTDTVPKQAALKHPDGWSIGGFAKGAGMCAPNMATYSTSPTLTTRCATRSRRPSTGSTSTAVRRPTTPCSCSARAPPG